MQGTLSIIGAGRVGRALGKRLRQNGWKIGAVVTRSEANSRRAVRFIGDGSAHGSLARTLLSSRVILIATTDASLSAVAKELARVGAEELRGKIVLHTSGTLSSSVLGEAKKYGAFVGSMHPLQSFSGVAAPSLEGRVFVVEGDPTALRVSRQMIRAFGGVPVRIRGEKKPLYHAGAALVSGLVLATEEAGTRLLMAAGMKRREAIRALLPLTRQVLDNFAGLGKHSAWTGPLARGDYNIIAAHVEAMKEQPEEFLWAYEALNRLAARVLAPDSERVLLELETVFGKQKVRSTGERA